MLNCIFPLPYVFFAEWQTSGEKLSFQSRQRGGRIFAEANRSPAGLLTLLQVRTPLAPAPLIAGSELLGREALLLGDHGSDEADGTTVHHPWNGSPPAPGSPLRDPCYAKARLQILGGAREALNVRAMKEASREVVGDVTKMLKGLAQRCQSGFVLLHVFY